jgi:hypothetical protein
MRQYKVTELYFKEKSGEIEEAIREGSAEGWILETLSTYSSMNDRWKRAHAVIVFSKDE